MTEAVEACPVHPQVQAFVRCSRCGRPACVYCLPGDGVVCTECHALDEANGLVPWERPDLGWVARFVRTVSSALGQPSATFERMVPAPAGRAVAFAALFHLLVAALTALAAAPMLDALMGGRFDRPSLAMFGCVVVGLPPVLAGLGVVASLLLGAIFHVGATACGGRARFSASLRVASYAQAFAAAFPVLFIAGLPFGIAPALLVVGFLGQLVYWGTCLSAAARGPHGLTGGRARLAGWLPSLLGFVLLLSVALVLYLLGDALAPDRAPAGYAPPVR